MTAPKKPQTVNLGALSELGEFYLKSNELPEERQSRLKREEAEAAHKLRMQEADESHKRQLALIVHGFALCFLLAAFVAGICVLFTADAKSGLPEKAMAMVGGIALVLASYVAGSKSK
ncbi:hypothetical protein [Singulisphaera acidiphila]|uniref:DUF2335 domain-containing protein n=1 Tax=Singulisphaera acidiphila (strain ATCC BAA-1392 / DSM 18658 / VKM B-2454 / MOB10) TaxID=886293 RepID=L0DET5_SINAD|nr:hypothetical protein [Singulisphaera acidiphila]AGA27191.1 hypothetical protein Sinac_2904 [Singulisphaera acidiphila DSM 18658]